MHHQTSWRSSRPEISKMFLKMSQNWFEKTCTRVSFLLKLQALDKTSRRMSVYGYFIYLFIYLSFIYSLFIVEYVIIKN